VVSTNSGQCPHQGRLPHEPN
jgi:Transposase DDE domain